MIRPRSVLAAMLLAASGLPARAQLYPALKPGMIPQSVAVIDDRGRAQDLMEILSGSRPILLLPIFTKCAGICPILAENLKAALGKGPGDAGFRVGVFSFDSTDTNEDLRSFRREMSLPAEWIMVRAAQAGDARGFLDQFGYVFMQAKSGFVHPGEVFVLSGKGRWSATFSGGSFPVEALKSAALEAEELDHPTPMSRFRRISSSPQAWAACAFAALLAAAAGAIVQSMRRRNGSSTANRA